jgi:hypothetical protein
MGFTRRFFVFGVLQKIYAIRATICNTIFLKYLIPSFLQLLNV